MEAYSRSFDYRRPVEGDPCTNYDGRYMRINMDECRENINSQMECPAMADGETRRNSGTRKLIGGFLDVVLLLSVTFHLQIIFKRKKFASRKFHILLLMDHRFVPK